MHGIHKELTLPYPSPHSLRGLQNPLFSYCCCQNWHMHSLVHATAPWVHQWAATFQAHELVGLYFFHYFSLQLVLLEPSSIIDTEDCITLHCYAQVSVTDCRYKA